MQKCLNCGQNIKYIATSKNESVTVNAERKTIVTHTGRIVVGYEIHICEGADGKK